MRNSNKSSYFSGIFSFSCREHFIAFVDDRGKTLKVEVRDMCSDEEWRGSFSANCNFYKCLYTDIDIEELTRKTGNFKRFDVFITMLSSLLSQRTKCLSIDFVSYADLENFQQISLKRGSPRGFADKVSCLNRRYLILTYKSDFDRTFYPLPLTYFGVVDKEALFRRIHKLRDTCFNKGNYKLMAESCSRPIDESEYNDRIAVLEKERDSALAELNRLRSVLRILHGEDDHEFWDVSISRPKTMKIKSSPKSCPLDRRSASMSTSSHNSGSRLHRSAVTGTASRMGSMTNNSERSLSHGGRLCGSSQSLPNSRSRKCSPLTHVSSNPLGKRSRSCSLCSSGSRRFDPTAYVREQRKKQQEAKQKRKLEELSRRSRHSPSPPFHTRSRYPLATRKVTPSTQLSTANLRHCQIPLWRPHFDTPSTFIASRGWNRVTPNECDLSGLNECHLQHASRVRDKRNAVHQSECPNQMKTSPPPADDVHLNRELSEMSRRLDNLQGFLTDYFSHLPV